MIKGLFCINIFPLLFSAPTENIMMENETENVTIENVEPTVNDLAFKLDTGIPDIEPEAETGPEDEPRAEPEDEPGPGAKPGPEDEPRAEPQVRGKLPYASSKSPITDKNYRLDKRTNWLYNIK